MKNKLKDRTGASLIIWILLVLVVAMALYIIVPSIIDAGKGNAQAEDEAHEQTCRDSAYLEWIAGGSFEAVYDYHGKKFVGLNDHPYQIEAYGSTEAHQDCVILVQCDEGGNTTLSWISRQTLRERYR